jgi:hypothetical protein
MKAANHNRLKKRRVDLIDTSLGAFPTLHQITNEDHWRQPVAKNNRPKRRKKNWEAKQKQSFLNSVYVSVE